MGYWGAAVAAAAAAMLLAFPWTVVVGTVAMELDGGDDGRPAVWCSVGETSGRCIVDTGATVGFIADDRAVPKGTVLLKRAIVRGVTGDEQGWWARLPVRMGGITKPVWGIVLRNYEGDILIGVPALKAFGDCLMIEWPQSRMLIGPCPDDGGLLSPRDGEAAERPVLQG